MSVSCQKNYSISVPIAVDAYWTLDESGVLTNRVDKVNSVALVPAAGNVMDARPGLFVNGLGFNEKGTFSQIDTGQNAHLGIQSSNGWSFFGWFKVVAWAAPGSFGGSPTIDFFNHIGLRHDCTLFWSEVDQQFELVIQDNNLVNYFPANFTPVVGAWTFFHVFFDPVLTQVGYSINNGAKVLAPTLGASFSEATSGDVTMFQNWSLADTANVEVVLDEIGLKLSRILTPAEVAFLFNNGNGRTWPLT